jgi:hypothetical protein
MQTFDTLFFKVLYIVSLLAFGIEFAVEKWKALKSFIERERRRRK